MGVGDRVAVRVGVGVDGGVGVGVARFPATIIATEVALSGASTVAAGTVGDLCAAAVVGVTGGGGVGDEVGVGLARTAAAVGTAATGVANESGVAVSMVGEVGDGLGARVGGIAVPAGSPCLHPATTRAPASDMTTTKWKTPPFRCSVNGPGFCGRAGLKLTSAGEDATVSPVDIPVRTCPRPVGARRRRIGVGGGTPAGGLGRDLYAIIAQ